MTPTVLTGEARGGQEEGIQRFDHGRTNLRPRGEGLGGLGVDRRKGKWPGRERAD